LMTSRISSYPTIEPMIEIGKPTALDGRKQRGRT
jgi:hypothetical protein